MLAIDFSQFPEVTTTRLFLRKITLNDAPAILQMRSDDQVMRYIDRAKATGMSDAEVFINRILKSLEDNDGITWAITFKEDPATVIGTIGYWKIIKEHYRAEIGYMLSPAHWKKGIMKEALVTILDFGFKQLNLHSIEANINPANSASEGILLSTGFVKEAHFKENFYFNGSFGDSIIYSRLQ